MLEQQGQRRGEILTLFLLSMVSKAGVRWESAMWLNVRNDKRNPVPQAGSSREGFTAGSMTKALVQQAANQGDGQEMSS